VSDIVDRPEVTREYLNAQNNEGWTALDLTSNRKIEKLLVRHGAEHSWKAEGIDAVTDKRTGRTRLLEEAKAGDSEYPMMSRLIRWGADVSVQDKKGRNTLHYFPSAGVMHKKGHIKPKGLEAALKAVDRRDRTPLDLALDRANIEDIRLLIKLERACYGGLLKQG